MAIYEKLMNVQNELKAPKGQFNSFGKYKYRSCEDILEAVKPVLKKYNAAIVLSDSVEVYGDRVYIKATATFFDAETNTSVTNTAYARESAEKKGMDDAQVTGTSSSYARKYALNGLLLIDDTKDDDTDEMTNEKRNRAAGKKPEPKEEFLTEKEQELIKQMVEKKGYAVAEIFPKGLGAIPASQYTDVCQKLAGMKEKA